ncbi:MAG: DNA-directed RNA polymerase subunit omega [Acidimicrobiales bacterium]
MAQRRNYTLMDPPIEDLLDKVDSKFTLVALSSKRARQINSYYNQLGEGMGMVVPPQVTSVSGKPLTIAFEEISAAKATFHRLEPGEKEELEALGVAGMEGMVEAEIDALNAAVETLGGTPVAVEAESDAGTLGVAVEEPGSPAEA